MEALRVINYFPPMIQILFHRSKVETGRKALETSSAQLETIFENLTASYQQ